MAQNNVIQFYVGLAKVRVHDSSLEYVASYRSFGDLDRSHMTAAGLGLEPR